MSFRKLFVLGISLILSGCLLTGCGGNNKKNISSKQQQRDYPVSINGINVHNKPSNVAVMSESIADVVLVLGYEGSLVCRSSECTQEALSELVDVGPIDNINIEAIKNAGVRYVLYDKELSNNTKKTLSDEKIVIIKLNPATTRSDLGVLYKNTGSFFEGNSGEKKADVVYKSILYAMDEIANVVPVQSISPVACYLYDEEGTVLTGKYLTGKAMEYVGLINFAIDTVDDKIDIDLLTRSNVAYIFCANGIKPKLMQDPRLAEVPAVKDNHVYEVDSTLTVRQGQSIINFLKEIAGCIYPDLLKSPADAAKEIKSSVTDEKKSTQTQVSEGTQSVDTTDIMKIQKRLDELNYLHTTPNGVLDNRMKQAIKDFKYINGKVVTDEINAEFINLLFSQDVKPRPTPARDKY